MSDPTTPPPGGGPPAPPVPPLGGGTETPPPPPGGPSPDRLPWERREELGWVAAFVETAKQLVTAPTAAWQRTPPATGDVASPLLFGVLASWVGAVVASLWGLAFSAPWLLVLPDDVPFAVGFSAFAGGVFGVVLNFVLAPIVAAVFLFIAAAILHGCLMLVGGLEGPSPQLETTFRVVAYASVARLGEAIPVVGELVGTVGWILLVVLGFTVLHRTPTGKAIAAVLIPVAVVCACVGAAVFTGLGIALTQQ